MIRKKIRLISGIFLIFALCMIGLVFVTARTTKAENETTMDLSQNFYMEEGAQVRVSDKSGIRFSTVVTQAFRDYIKTTYGEDTTAEYHTIIGAGIDCTDPYDNVAKAFASEEGDVVYREVIFYDNLPEELKQSAYTTELNAKAYVKIFSGEADPVTIWAYQTDNLRSMRGVALAARMSSEYSGFSENAVAAIKNYLGGEITFESAFTANSTEITAYYDNSSSTGKIAVNVPEGDYTVYFGARKIADISITESDSSVDISNITGLTAGNDYQIALFNASTHVVYTREFKAVTKVIATAQDLSIFAAKAIGDEFGGYYLLGNDIDATGYTHTATLTNSTIGQETNIIPNTKLKGLTGTFDGNGHTISGLALGYSSSLFGTIYNGTVKNVAVKVSSVASGSELAPLAWYTYNGSIENVYIEVESIPDSWSKSAFVGNLHSGTTVNNVIIKLYNESFTTYGGYASFNFSGENTSGNWGNVYVISKIPLTVKSSGIVIDGENISETNKYVGIKRYDNDVEFANVSNDYTSFSESGMWNTEGDYPVFKGGKGVKIISETIDYSIADGFTASDMTAIFGEENVTILSVKDNMQDYEASVSDGKLSFTKGGVEFTGDGTVHNIVLSTENVEYSVNLKLVTKIIREKEDLSIFAINDKEGAFNGYYLLGADIDATGYTHATGINEDISSQSGRWFTTVGYGNCGLKGTFDGNGHTISNLTIGRFGMFGVINGGTVKNVALKDVKFTSAANVATLAWYILDANIENVYMSAVTLPAVWGRAMFSSAIYQSEVSNVVISLQSVAGNTLNTYGSLGAYGSFVASNAVAELANTTPNEFSNVYVISTTKLSVLSASQFDGENKDATNCYAGIKRYDDEAEFAGATGNDYTSFSESGMWTLGDNGTPVFGKRQ